MTTKNNGIKAIALLEASKGIISLLVGFGLHSLAGQNLQHFAESVVAQAHLNPASHYPSIFIHAASSVSDSNIKLFAVGAFVYSIIRLVEAYGLWRGYVWIEWFALLSGAIYIPFEIYEIVSHPNTLNISVFLINLVVVWYLAHVVLNKRKDKSDRDLIVD